MATVLITNDDGIDSPTLVPLAAELRRCFDTVRVVVPADERSWTAKAITRFGVVDVQATERAGIPMYAVNGTPADCVSLGVHTLYPGPPDLVVSGINLGLNFGSAFLLSSGTVGGALEAWIAGVPAIAFSMAIPNDAYGLTGAHRIAALGGRPAVAAQVSRDITAAFVREGYPAGVDCCSVNMPADVAADTPRVVARVTRARYGPLFVRQPAGGYRHHFQSFEALEDRSDGDVRVVARGEVAITPLRLDFSADLPAALRAALERTVG